MTQEQAEFAVECLRTPLGERWTTDTEALSRERTEISKRYHDLKKKYPSWSFSRVSSVVRGQWLREFVEGLTDARGD